jgi:uncharacterized membrane protein
MNQTYVHLLLNHIPIIGNMVGLSIILYGIISKSKVAVNIASTLFIVCALITIPVFLTGEPAEETVENIAGVSETAIEPHEEAAEIALWLMQALGVLSIITLFMNWKESPLARRLALATFIISLLSFSFIAYAGKLGGEIRHTEITGSGQSTHGVESDDEEQDDE